MNELIFFLHSIGISLVAVCATYFGKRALTTFIALSLVMANFLVIKQITLFGFQVTATDAFIVGSVLALNLLNEYYGKKAAQQAIWIAFGSGVFVTILTQIHLLYVPNPFDTSQEHFVYLFSATPRIVTASLISYLISQLCENSLYSFLKNRFEGNYLLFRNYLTMSISQLIDTILFSFLGLYGLVSTIGDIIVVSYGIKLLAVFFVAPFIWLSTLFLHKKPHEVV